MNASQKKMMICKARYDGRCRARGCVIHGHKHEYEDGCDVECIDFECTSEKNTSYCIPYKTKKRRNKK